MSIFFTFSIIFINSCDNSDPDQYERELAANKEFAQKSETGKLNSTKKKNTNEQSVVDSTSTSTPTTTDVPETSSSDFVTDGGYSYATGLKTWCWGDIEITENTNSDSNSFSGGQLRTNSHCNTGMITKVGDRLHFSVNPTSPVPQGWCSSSYNYRAEVRESPSDPDHPMGTEQWFGWDYQFDQDYKADQTGHWLMWQVHAGSGAPSSPQMSLWIASKNMAGYTNNPGEIFVINAARDKDNHQYTPTGITPTAGSKLKIVVHVIFGDEQDGLLQIWINDNMVYNQNIRTVYAEKPVGGYAKWGIYKWKWKDKSFVDSSRSQGIQELNTSMGALRVLTRRPGDQGYKTNAYDVVVPR